MKQQKILVVGSLNMDMVVEMDTIPVRGQTVLTKNLAYIPGGKGANQAYACGNLGGDITMLGAIGDDDFGKHLLASLEGAHVDTSQIRTVSQCSTGIAVIYVERSGNNSIAVIPGANAYCDVAYLQSKDQAFQEADIVMLQMEVPMDAVYYAIKRGKELGKTVILNPAPANIDTSADIYPMVDYFTPNETELYLLATGDANVPADVPQEQVEQLSRMMQEKGVGTIVTTMGKAGALAVGDAVTHHPGYQVSAVDTTAAGDCFNGGFAVALAAGKTQEEAIAFANAAASISVTRKGAQQSLPTREEVEAKMQG